MTTTTAAKQDCTNCALAKWQRTKTGRLHPSGDGQCQWRMPEVIIPRAFYYHTWSHAERDVPAPSGGYIDRRKAHTNCPTWKATE